MSLFNLIKLVMNCFYGKEKTKKSDLLFLVKSIHMDLLQPVAFWALGVIRDNYLDRLLQNSRLLDQLALFAVSLVWLPSVIQIELECFGACTGVLCSRVFPLAVHEHHVLAGV